MQADKNDIQLKAFGADCALNRFRRMFIYLSHDKMLPIASYDLSVLTVLNDVGEATMSELAEYCGFSKSKITRAMDSLVENKLAYRFAKPKNRRTVYAAATQAGKEIVKAQTEEIWQNYIKLTDKFSNEDINLLAKCYEDILNLYQKYCGLLKSPPYKAPAIKEGESINVEDKEGVE